MFYIYVIDFFKPLNVLPVLQEASKILKQFHFFHKLYLSEDKIMRRMIFIYMYLTE